MKSKFTHEEKQAILDRYISKSESPTSIIKSVGISKSTFYKWLSDYRTEQAEAKRKGLTLRNFKLLEAKVKRLEGLCRMMKALKKTAWVICYTGWRLRWAFRLLSWRRKCSVLRNIPRKPSASRFAMRRRNGSRSAFGT